MTRTIRRRNATRAGIAAIPLLLTGLAFRTAIAARNARQIRDASV